MPITHRPIISYGEMYQYNSDVLNIITINTIDVWEIIDGMLEGDTKNFTFQNSQELVCLFPGKYKIDYSLCWTDGVGNIYEFVVFINGIIQTKTIACGRKGNAVDIVTSSGTGIIDLIENDIVTLKVRNRTTTTDLELISTDINLNWLGVLE